jgi:tetratricopeptide (TPR) repeat protein
VIGNADAAEKCMRKAAEIEPAGRKAQFGLGAALRALGRLKEAASAYEHALALQEDEFDCLMRLVDCRLALGELSAAETLARLAIERDGVRAIAWDQLGVALARQGRHREAAVALEHAMHLNTNDSEGGDTFVNAANNLLDDNNIGGALAVLEANLAKKPNPEGHYEYAVGLLTAGRLLEGWHHYEFRWLRDPLLSLRLGQGRPPWKGQELRGKTILIRAEQGVGDTIQFIRYAPKVKALGARVLLKVQEGTGLLAQAFPGVDAVIGRGEVIPDFDFYIHPLSLPHIFGTDSASVPAGVPYLRADPAFVDRWARRLNQPRDGLKAGLAWAGSPSHGRDRYRSMPSSMLAPLGSVRGVRYFGLQKGDEEREACPVNAEFANLGAELHDFGDTAAAISQLDLVICVDTAVAHLAGALGKPVWVMLAKPADWRWLEEREDTPWYPTMRLFRQRESGDWADVVERVKVALERWVEAGGGEPARGTPVELPVEPLLPKPTLARFAPGHRAGFSAVAETRVGIVQYFPDEAGVGDSISWYGEYLQGQLDVLARLIRPGATLLEVGAGVGMHALYLARAIGPAGQMFLYESRPLLQRVLRQNLAANRIGNVTLMSRALGCASSVSGTDMPTETLDELQLEQLQLLKIGADASALEVLAGGSQTLWRLRPLLFIALREEEALPELVPAVEDLGYRCWKMETPLFHRQNFNRREEDIFGGGKASALLAIPEEINVDATLDDCVELS